jgi:hypothetical protein
MSHFVWGAKSGHDRICIKLDSQLCGNNLKNNFVSQQMFDASKLKENLGRYASSKQCLQMYTVGMHFLYHLDKKAANFNFELKNIIEVQIICRIL